MKVEWFVEDEGGGRKKNFLLVGFHEIIITSRGLQQDQHLARNGINLLMMEWMG